MPNISIAVCRRHTFKWVRYDSYLSVSLCELRLDTSWFNVATSTCRLLPYLSDKSMRTISSCQLLRHVFVVSLIKPFIISYAETLMILFLWCSLVLIWDFGLRTYALSLYSVVLFVVGNNKKYYEEIKSKRICTFLMFILNVSNVKSTRDYHQLF